MRRNLRSHDSCAENRGLAHGEFRIIHFCLQYDMSTSLGRNHARLAMLIDRNIG
jgi:hypothetical protein